MSHDYLRESRRPLVSLAFVLPLLVLYEGGVLYLGPGAMRNGADVWLRRWLDQLGFGQYFLLPALTIGLLLAWHHTTRERWQLRREVLVGMYVESSLLAVALLGIGYLQRSVSHLALEFVQARLPVAEVPAGDAWQSAAWDGVRWNGDGAAWDGAARLIGFCGAGIYEEMLFRLILVPVVLGIATLLALRGSVRVAAAIVVTSALFSAAHYTGVHGDAFDWFSFSFRFLAGAFFALLFVWRRIRHRGRNARLVRHLCRRGLKVLDRAARAALCGAPQAGSGLLRPFASSRAEDRATRLSRCAARHEGNKKRGGKKVSLSHFAARL